MQIFELSLQKRDVLKESGTLGWKWRAQSDASLLETKKFMKVYFEKSDITEAQSFDKGSRNHRILQTT